MISLKTGMEYCQWFNITQEMVLQFTELTGDKNPVHLDEQYASTTMFKKCIAPGMLIGGLLSKIIGMDFPGNGSIYLGQDIQFIAPVYIDTRIKISCIVDSVDTIKNNIVLKNIVESENGEILIKGTSKIKVLQSDTQ